MHRFSPTYTEPPLSFQNLLLSLFILNTLTLLAYLEKDINVSEKYFKDSRLLPTYKQSHRSLKV